MRILLCNNTLSLLAGSEIYTYTLAVELKRKGHDVSCFSFSHGAISDKLKEFGIESYKDIPQFKPDVIIGNHYQPTEFLKIMGAPIIFTLHSVYGINVEGHPEQPVKNVRSYVAISEEIQKLYATIGYPKTKIIRNGIDLTRFKETKPRNKKVKTVLLNSNYLNESHIFYQNLKTACNVLCINLLPVGESWQNIWDMENVINEVDIVFSLGRGCLEAMACNRPAVVYGHNGVDGKITQESYEELRKVNYSGRANKDIYDVPKIVEIINGCENDDFDYRKLVEDNDIVKCAHKYLSLIK